LFDDLHRDSQKVVKTCRAEVTQLDFGHHKNAIASSLQVALMNAKRTQPLSARPLKKLQVIGIKHHATSVGVFPIDPHWQGKISFGHNGHFQNSKGLRGVSPNAQRVRYSRR